MQNAVTEAAAAKERNALRGAGRSRAPPCGAAPSPGVAAGARARGNRNGAPCGQPRGAPFALEAHGAGRRRRIGFPAEPRRKC